MSWGNFTNSLLLILFLAFATERFLALLFETEQFIDAVNERKGIKPLLAVIFGMALVLATNINIADMAFFQPTQDTKTSASIIRTTEGYRWDGGFLNFLKNAFLLLVTGTFVASGSKASLKLFRDIWKIRSSSEEDRLNEKEAKKHNKLSQESASGNGSAADQLNNALDKWYKSRKK